MASTYVVFGVLSSMRWVSFPEAVLISSKMFFSNLGSGAQDICITDVPSMEEFVSSNSKCTFLCAGQKECHDYNYVKTKSLCQIFYYTPKSYAKVDNRKSYSSMVSNYK